MNFSSTIVDCHNNNTLDTQFRALAPKRTADAHETAAARETQVQGASSVT